VTASELDADNVVAALVDDRLFEGPTRFSLAGKEPSSAASDVVFSPAAAGLPSSSPQAAASAEEQQGRQKFEILKGSAFSMGWKTGGKLKGKREGEGMGVEAIDCHRLFSLFNLQKATRRPTTTLETETARRNGSRKRLRM